MRRRRYVHEGSQLATAFIIDPQLIGHDGARARVLELWQPTASLFELPDTRWILRLTTAREVTTTCSPGLTAVLDSSKRLTTSPDLPDAPELERVVVEGWHNGSLVRYTRSELQAIHPSDWIMLSVPTERLWPIGTTTPADATIERQPAPPVNLRSAANVGPGSGQAQGFLNGIRDQAKQNAMLVQGRRRPRRRRGSDAASRAVPRKARPAWASAVAKMVLGSPIRNEVSKRHQRYLDRLTRDFTSGNYHDALREAIGLGAEGANSALSLRLPQRRSGLTISGPGAAATASVPWGETIHQHLRALYKQAAVDLEAKGRVDEAAFVLAELLGSSYEAVGLFERHKRFAQGATLAENRRLDAAIAARLWWLAGEHDRALALAHKAGAFAAVLARIEAVSAEEGHRFRLRWVDHLESSGSLLAAVNVGWPDDKIRPLLRNMIRRGVDLGGAAAPALLAYGLILEPTRENEAAVSAMLMSAGADGVRTFARTLAALDASATQTSLRVTSETVRSLLRTGRGRDQSMDKVYKTLLRRCDPVLRADAPASLPAATTSDLPVEVALQPEGVLPVADASAVSSQLILVALGEYGCRLIRPDGRTVVHWDVPTHSLVMADHGGSALLLTGRDPVIEVHRLDLTTRKILHYGTVESALWASTFSGSSWVAHDARGLTWYDLFADQPTVAWRELDRHATCHALSRSEDQLSVVLSNPTVSGTQMVRLYQWDLPSRGLRQQVHLKAPMIASRVQVTSNGVSIWDVAKGEPPQTLSTKGAGPKWFEPGDDIATEGPCVARLATDGKLHVLDVTAGSRIAVIEMDAANWGFRANYGFVTVSDSSGRILVLNIEQRTVVAATRIVS